MRSPAASVEMLPHSSEGAYRKYLERRRYTEGTITGNLFIARDLVREFPRGLPRDPDVALDKMTAFLEERGIKYRTLKRYQTFARQYHTHLSEEGGALLQHAPREESV